MSQLPDSSDGGIQRLVSLPAGSAATFAQSDPRRARQAFVLSDPPGRQLGSGGGTAYLLDAARRQAPGAPGFDEWLRHSRKLIIHGSGESRRLPAYAAAGKPLVPIPHLCGACGEPPDQILLDLQADSYERLFWFAPASYRLMVTCGDVLLRWTRPLPPYPDADVLIVGMAASIEEAQSHGVMVCSAADPTRMLHFLQKPKAEELNAIAASSTFFLDTGVWLMTARAVAALLNACGWPASGSGFAGGLPQPFDLYGAFGPALGQNPTTPAPGLSELRCAVLPLTDARFYHFGTNRSLLASTSRLREPPDEMRAFGHASMDSHVAPIVQFSRVACPLGPAQRHIWIENSCIPAGWRLTQRHVLTNVPDNDWNLSLADGTCLDCVPAPGGRICLRFYGFDDPFRGRIDHPETLWLGRSAAAWFRKRKLEIPDPGADIHDAALFPSLDTRDLTPEFVRWLVDDAHAGSDGCRRQWQKADRLSSRDLLRSADPQVTRTVRLETLKRAVANQPAAAWLDECRRMDLSKAAEVLGPEDGNPPDPAAEAETGPDRLALVHDRMYRFARARAADPAGAAVYEQEAFAGLRSLIARQMELEPTRPTRSVQEDQIVWGRSPVRLDLAGGWTDTPPYCLEHGGRVINLAVDLNGQPPIQVFGRISPQPEIRLRSVDLGSDECIRTYEELENCGPLGGGFGIGKAALALAGFLPRFHARGGFASLADQLRAELGGGLELSMVCAVPKGSGLGTSSVLAATILGTVSEICGLGWTRNDLFLRTLALEQLLTSGGGWQDQVGGIEPGVKLIETEPGITQKPVIRWLPSSFFTGHAFSGRFLLYYTGITRLAHGILGEIVRGLFLNSATHLGIIEEIGRNAQFTADALQRNDWDRLCEGIRRSWILNQRLDSGTNPPSVQAILDAAGDGVEACKLLGAGGGGYLLMLARDVEASARIRQRLMERPPNPRARFVEMTLSGTGFQVTRS